MGGITANPTTMSKLGMDVRLAAKPDAPMARIQKPANVALACRCMT
jgi:hypothetical protein